MAMERENSRIGVPEKGSYKVIFDTDAVEFGGKGVLKAAKKTSLRTKAAPMHGFDNSISLTIPAMSVMYLRKSQSKNKKANPDKVKGQ